MTRAPASGDAILGVRLAWPAPLVPARVLARVNRFAVRVALDGAPDPVLVHLPNSGRMTELLVPGAAARVQLPGAAPAMRVRRAAPADEVRGTPPPATRGRLLLVRHGRRWVGVDAHVPNRVVEAALGRGGLGPITGVRSWRREVALGGERIDFVVGTRRRRWWLEAKSCNRVVAGEARFPDAPTLRGARHLELLARVAAAGRRAAVVWIVQRADARCLRPDATVDPAFAAAARRAARAGVRLLAYVCEVSTRGLAVVRRVPVVVG